MGVNNTRLPMSGGPVRPPGYSPPAGTASGIPGAAYPVMGSAPITNMQPRYASPGAAQIRPGMTPPTAMPQTPVPAAQGGMPQNSGSNPQQLATALTQMSGGRPGMA